jgi:carbonic anhydrase
MVRTPGGTVTPYQFGVGETERLIEQAINDQGIQQLVVCGHLRCDATIGLESDHPVAAAEARVLAQVSHLLTHPAVASARARNRARIWRWLYDDSADELLSPDSRSARFVSLVALRPDQNWGLRPEAIHRPRPGNTPSSPELRRIWLA